MSRYPALLVPLAAGLLLTACEPKSPDRAEWRDDAYYAVSDTSSAVATATLVVRQLTSDKIQQNYAQVVLVAAEEEAGKQSSSFDALQPATVDTDRYHQVTSALSDAGDVLSDVRIAVARQNTGAYPDLLQQLDQQTQALDKVESDLGGLRGKP
ncbi:MAG TPA: hypothetical protein VJ872_04055 [Nocardioides sp.]|nr:hypothetical protein [Nocardioides sp.]